MSDALGAPVRLKYLKIRDISTKDEEVNGAAAYSIVMSASEILKVGTDGNLRDYIPDHQGKKRSIVHKQIERTIYDKPDRFAQLNSGFLIAASRVEIDDSKKSILVYDASVNNGAQSQGEVRRYFASFGERATDFAIRAEISVEPDAAMRTEIAIARNTATRVQDLSQAGKRGYFKDLIPAFNRVFPDFHLSTSETDIGDEFVDTRLLLQILWAMVPKDLMPAGRTSIDARMRAYKNAASCLSDFETMFKSREDPEHPEIIERYKYFVDMAGVGWQAYKKWSTHPNWQGRYLHEDAGQVSRKNGESVVADGIVFPILAALSNFVVKDSDDEKWTLQIPNVFRDDDMIEAARRQLKQHQGRPVYMGRSGAAYEALMLLTEMAVRYTSQER